MSSNDHNVIVELGSRFGDQTILHQQSTKDGIATIWTEKNNLIPILKYLKTEITLPFRMLYDLTGIDERTRINRNGQPDSDFTIVYHLTSFERNEDNRLKIPLKEKDLSIPCITSIWESANWYEREVYDMFGVDFNGHPRLTRILMPKTWQGYPLRKEHPSRATELDPFVLTEQIRDEEESNLKFNPEEYGLDTKSDDSDFMFLNIGPQHPGTHGYHIPCWILAMVFNTPTGRRLISNININPALIDQNAILSNLVLHTYLIVRPFITNSISPIPRLPKTPKRAA